MLNNKGQSLVLFVLLLPIMLGIMALVIDVGNVFVKKNHIDNVIMMVMDVTLDKDLKQDEVEKMRQQFEARRNFLVEHINALDGVSCLKPEGAFYIMMNIEKLIGRTLGGVEIRSASDFAMAFLEKGLVAVVACDAFGISNFVRWTYATSMENIMEGLDRLEKFLAKG